MDQGRLVPITSIAFPTEESRSAAQAQLYLAELDRQAEIALNGLSHALTLGLVTKDNRDPGVWAALQSALFAAVIVARTLQPTPHGKYPGMTSSETKTYARNRSESLTNLLEIDSSSPLFSIFPARNAFEHYDERLDVRLIEGATCVSDWYISDGTALVTPPENNGPATAIGLRVFFPAGGVLYFENEALDLFALDIALLDLRLQIKEKQETLRTKVRGRALYGGHLVVKLIPDSAVIARRNDWQQIRGRAIADLDTA